MKRLLIISKKEELDLNVDGFIIGIKNLSVNLPIYFSFDETIKIIKKLTKKNKEIFVSLNKNMHNNDIDYLKEILINLNSYKITGVIFYDVSIVNLKSKLNLDYDLIWHQEHMTTNYFTCNYWYNHDVRYAYLSSEITLDEIKEIKENTKMKLMVNAFGYLPMFVSKRHLVKNYLDNFNLKDKSKEHYIRLNDNIYPIIDNVDGTIAYSSYVFNGVLELSNLNLDYIVYNSYKISDIEEILNNENLQNYQHKGFLFKETIYKVKK